MNTVTSTQHRYDVMHHVDTGEHRCLCGWTPATPYARLQKRAIAVHASAATKRGAA